MFTLQYRLHLLNLTALLFLLATTASAKECVDCHADVLKQFNGNSHHIQGVNATGKHCYACHWEATEEGQINSKYHEVSGSGKTTKSTNRYVDLVVWEKGSRPINYQPNSTVVLFKSSAVGGPGERAEVAKVTQHCLGCHSDNSNNVSTFAGDSKTPLAYAWDGQSVASRYAQKGIIVWGKYSTAATNKKARIVKSFSAHGNSVANIGGWSQANGYDGNMPLTRGGSSAKNVECFDCHNSHGSLVPGVTSSYRSFDGKNNGGILKETTAGKSGYRMTYQPSVNSNSGSKNPYNAGAGLCFDCHETARSGGTPWGYNSTFGADAPILGYKDTPGFGSGNKGSNKRFSNRQSRNDVSSSHLKAGKALSHLPEGQINGLCTPCHDPHGVSKTLGDGMKYAVPLLKGTWLTSPYREDGPPSSTNLNALNALGRDANSSGSAFSKDGGGSPKEPMKGMKYSVDRNTFGGEKRISESDETFGGVCLKCHSKASLSDGAKTSSVHRAVKGWGGNKEHSFPCSKCHQPHSSGLPRLMQTNCFEQGPSGLRENSGVPWLPYSKSGNSMPQNKVKKAPESSTDSRKIVGCHVRQFGGAIAPGAGREQQGGSQWNEKTKW